MNSRVNLIRAIGGEFIYRKMISIAIVFIIVALVVGLGAVWLVTVNVWWWLLAIPVFVGIAFGVVGIIVTRFLLGVVRPQLSEKQKSMVNQFVDKLERIAENMRTPLFLIILRITKDVLWPRQNTFIAMIAKDSTTLHSDFRELKRLF